MEWRSKDGSFRIVNHCKCGDCERDKHEQWAIERRSDKMPSGWAHILLTSQERLVELAAFLGGAAAELASPNFAERQRIRQAIYERLTEGPDYRDAHIDDLANDLALAVVTAKEAA